MAPLSALGAQSGVAPGFMLSNTESPPSCSLTASPERTTEKKLIKIGEPNFSVSAKHKRPVEPPVFKCLYCPSELPSKFVAYRSDPALGNCEHCGAFFNYKAAPLAAKNSIEQNISSAVRERFQSFRAEVEMDVILVKLVEDARQITPRYHEDAFYLGNREAFVEWMFNLAEKL